MMLGKGLLYENFRDTSTLTSTTITKEDRRCLPEEEHLTCARMNIAAKQLERLSPHKGTRKIVSMCVTGFEDTYEGGRMGRGNLLLLSI
eukprot:10954722-Ditylum_brightwellii.AAC.1